MNELHGRARSRLRGRFALLGFLIACGDSGGTTEPGDLTPPTLTIHVSTAEGIVVTWAVPPTGATNLQFERRIGDGGTFQLVATLPATAANFTDAATKEDGLPLATLEIYNAATGTWRAGANMPEERGGHAAAVLNGEIYVVGGVGVNHALRTALLIYNPTTDQWRTGPSMSVPREHLTAAAVGNRIYAIGGRVTLDQARFGETTTNMNTVEAFDVLDQQWQTVAGMLTARGGLFAATSNNRIYVMGGEFPGIFAEVEEYNPQNNSWRTMTPMRQARHATGTATVGDTIFTMGGGPRFGFAESNTNHGFVVPRP